MRILLDTHTFLWWNSRDERLPQHLREAIKSPQNTVYVSAVTVWEIAIKRAIGKLNFGLPIATAIEGHGFSSLAISVEHAEWAGALPSLHRDPFDRLLVAQAHVEALTLATVDSKILTYQVPHL
jgi:PIN domain nuclease of toxin-antitoxin system